MMACSRNSGYSTVFDAIPLYTSFRKTKLFFDYCPLPLSCLCAADLTNLYNARTDRRCCDGGIVGASWVGRRAFSILERIDDVVTQATGTDCTEQVILSVSSNGSTML